MKKTKIGIIGESSYDDKAMINLLVKQFPNLQFQPLLPNALVRGSHIYTSKFERMIKSELQSSGYHLVIFSIDLDELEGACANIRQKEHWISKFESLSNNLLLLHIFEMEGLILADVETFNEVFNAKVKFGGDPMKKENPKEFLMRKTAKSQRQFSEKENPFIFSRLDFEKLKKCRYFGEFITIFVGKL